MQLIAVSDKNTVKTFYQVPYVIYEGDPNWIPPLKKDLAFVFDEEGNPAFQDGECQRYVLKANDGSYIGRIAVFTKSKSIQNESYEVGGIGFFECINDQDAAFTLFDQAKQWLEERNVKAMDGPVNFGERDKFWGLLVEGFKKPSYQENYNPPYYQELFEAYGFQEYFRQETFEVYRGGIDLERMRKITERMASNDRVKVRTLELNKLDQYVEDFIGVYNRALENCHDFKPLTAEEVKELFKQVKSILERDFMIFLYINDHPAGILFMLPDVNQIFQYFNGKLGWWEKLKFLWYAKIRTMDKLKGVVIGIHPDFQNKGVDAMMVYNLMLNVEKNGNYNHAELSWIGDFNPKMKAMMQKLNAEKSKVHITYRKLFDPNLPFEPYKIKN